MNPLKLHTIVLLHLWLMCVCLVFDALVCIGLWGICVNMVLAWKFLVLDFVLLMFGIIPKKWYNDF